MVSPQLLDWAAKTSWHGISDLSIAKSNLSRILWICVIFYSFLMFISGIYSHIYEYINGATWVTVNFNEEQPNGMKFPKLVICDLNMASKTRIKELNMSLDAARFVWKSVKETKARNIERRAFLKFLVKNNATVKSSTQWIHKMAPKCEDLLIRCTLGPLRKKFSCCDNMEHIYVHKRGLCYLFSVPDNILKSFPQKQVGTAGGLQIVVNPAINDYDTAVWQIGFEAGLLIYAGYDPLTSLYSTPVAVNPGSKNYISMSVSETRIYHQQRKYPNNLYIYFPEIPCKLDGVQKILDGNYTFEACMDECALEQQLLMCGCVGFAHVQSNIFVCNLIQWQRCLKNYDRRGKSVGRHRALRKCWSNCKRQCFESMVLLRQSSTMYQTLAKNIIENGTNITLNPDVAPIELFFQSVTIQVSEMQERMPIEMVVANIGGTLGVWAGISLITVYQGLVYLCAAVFGKIHVMKRTK